MKSSLFPYARLLRLYNAPFHGAIPVLGALAMGYTSLPHLLVLFIIGLLVHGFFSMTNEVIDEEEDRRVGDLRAHPIAAGEINASTARIMGLAFPILAVLLAMVFFNDWPASLFLVLSLSLFGVYNIVNKSLPGIELILASAFAALALFGSAVGGMTSGFVALLFAAATGLHVLSILTIYLGLWMTQFRKEGEKMSMTAILGARKRGGRFLPTGTFLSYGAIIQSLFFVAVMLPFLMHKLPYSRGQMVILFMLVLASTLVTYRMLVSPFYKPREIRITSAIHYVLVGAALPTMLAGVTPWVMLLALLPIIEVCAITKLLGSGLVSPPLGTTPPRMEVDDEGMEE